ncbi:MAG: hypothetical protein JRN58_05435 [Nitrososphaerota archaeon]|nr:hypothetical protein [Nitrososphaerota archaeon]
MGPFSTVTPAPASPTGPFAGARTSSVARTHRAPRRSPPGPRASTKPRAPGAARTIRKRLD